ncbi:MAG: glycosyltransferase [Syntrophothermus sp.]
MPKVLLLSDPTSAHTIKWINSLYYKGVDVYLFGLSEVYLRDYPGIPEEHFFNIFVDNSLFKKEANSKLIYLKALPVLKKIIKKIKPDIVHAHYASSYGLLGSLLNFHPFIISVWGSDIYDFPKKSFINKNIIKYNLSKADKILSTSSIMAEEVRKYTQKNILVTPFGIDTNRFKPSAKSIYKDSIIIGTIKTLEKHYGIDFLIKAFSNVCKENKNVKLLIVGEGTEEENLKRLASQFSLKDKIIFTGKVPYDKVVCYHNEIDIFVALSIEESFGVSVLESASCSKPVVVSNADGFKEIVVDGITGIIVNKRDETAAAEAIKKLLLDKDLRITMGKAGRESVLRNYNLNENTERMIKIYKEFSQQIK